jgi:enterochelin esterase family protein
MKRTASRLTRIAALIALVCPAFGADKKDDKPKARKQENAIVSPDIHEDNTVTFRLRAPEAQKVEVSLAIPKDGNIAMIKGDDGVWSVNTPPLEPDIYEYSLVVDGVRVIDPANRDYKPARQTNTSLLHIPGKPPLLHDFQNVPHGAVTTHEYMSKSLKRLRRVRVYTPPGYAQDATAKFPTLYLFHGSGDNEGCWSDSGKAHHILDNLIAQKKAVPMLIVMPDGHAIPQGGVPNGNVEAFEKDLLEDVLPLVESNYRAIPDAMHRSIIGLSMGGGQSLIIGINHYDQFAWIGGMSAYVPEAEKTIGPAIAKPDFAEKVKLLWFAIGREDFLLEGNKTLDAFLTAKNVKHDFILTDGAHRWPVWRKYLADFAPLIFKQ